MFEEENMSAQSTTADNLRNDPTDPMENTDVASEAQNSATADGESENGALDGFNKCAKIDRLNEGNNLPQEQSQEISSTDSFDKITDPTEEQDLYGSWEVTEVPYSKENPYLNATPESALYQENATDNIVENNNPTAEESNESEIDVDTSILDHISEKNTDQRKEENFTMPMWSDAHSSGQPLASFWQPFLEMQQTPNTFQNITFLGAELNQEPTDFETISGEPILNRNINLETSSEMDEDISENHRILEKCESQSKDQHQTTPVCFDLNSLGQPLESLENQQFSNALQNAIRPCTEPFQEATDFKNISDIPILNQNISLETISEMDEDISENDRILEECEDQSKDQHQTTPMSCDLYSHGQPLESLEEQLENISENDIVEHNINLDAMCAELFAVNPIDGNQSKENVEGNNNCSAKSEHFWTSTNEFYTRSEPVKRQEGTINCMECSNLTPEDNEASEIEEDIPRCDHILEKDKDQNKESHFTHPIWNDLYSQGQSSAALEMQHTPIIFQNVVTPCTELLQERADLGKVYEKHIVDQNLNIETISANFFSIRQIDDHSEENGEENNCTAEKGNYPLFSNEFLRTNHNEQSNISNQDSGSEIFTNNFLLQRADTENSSAAMVEVENNFAPEGRQSNIDDGLLEVRNINSGIGNLKIRKSKSSGRPKPYAREKITNPNMESNALQSIFKRTLMASHPHLRLTASTLKEMQIFLLDMIHRVGDEAEELITLSNKKLVNPRILKYAIKFSLKDIKKQADVDASKRK